MALSSQVLSQFLTVYRQRSLGRACREIGLSQPALSKAIRRLEDQLGVLLFERSAAGMAPTAYADALALRAKIVQSEIRRAASEIEHMRSNLTGEARIGIGPALAATTLPTIMADLLSQHRGLNLVVFEGLSDVLAQWVVAGEVDFAVTTMPFATSRRGLVTDVLFRDRFVVAASADHALAPSRHIVAAEDLLAFPWVLPPRDGTLWQRVLDLFERQGLRAPEPQVETNSGVCIKGLLLTGRFLSFVPRQLVAHEESKGDIVLLASDRLHIEREVFVLTREGSILSPGAEAIIGEFRRRGGGDRPTVN